MADADKELTSWICGRTDNPNVEQADNADYTGTVGIGNKSASAFAPGEKIKTGDPTSRSTTPERQQRTKSYLSPSVNITVSFHLLAFDVLILHTNGIGNPSSIKSVMTLIVPATRTKVP